MVTCPPYGPGNEALTTTKAIVDEVARARTLAALAPHLPPELRGDVLNEALTAAKAIGSVRWVEVLAAVAPHLPPAQVNEALAAAKAIGEYYRVQFFK
jgi:hypothetical protein